MANTTQHLIIQASSEPISMNEESLARFARKCAYKAQMTMEHHITLADMDAWEAFVVDNRDALESEYGSTATAYQHAIQGGLTLGRGAAPLFTISFED